MKTGPIEPAEIDIGADGTPRAPRFGDVYHPAGGALPQARHVFLAGNGLPDRWRRRDRFVVLETGFGLGNNFLATWEAWRRDTAHCRTLVFVSIERHPPTLDALSAVPRDASIAALAASLAEAWPPLTPNLHRLEFERGAVQLLLAFGDVADWLRELVGRADAFYLDGFAPDRNPQMWQPRVFQALARLAAPGATAATWSAARAVRAGLASAGFQVELAPGQGGKRDITVARYAPSFEPRRPPARASGERPQRVAIIGGGLAGCSAAWALAQQGIDSIVIDRHAEPAQEASGNPAGLFHGAVHADDGVHARLHRAAALQVVPAIATALREHAVRGEIHGLLRLAPQGADPTAMRALLVRQGVPPEHLQALDATEACERARWPVPGPAWWYSQGGWVDPAGLARSYLARAGTHARWQGGNAVAFLRQEHGRWTLLDGTGATLAEVDAVVLANAADAARLGGVVWPLHTTRGQLSRVAAPHLAGPCVPIAGHGYVLPPRDGEWLFGATSRRDADDEPALSAADHAENLDQLASLGADAAALTALPWSGRVGWRCHADDRLPLIGAVPDLPADRAQWPTRWYQPRFVPRRRGLYVYTALGSRGITWSALGAQVLSSWISGAPCPLEASLLDALDPARFASRALRRAASTSSTSGREHGGTGGAERPA